jgi:hypothetical protein
MVVFTLQRSIRLFGSLRLVSWFVEFELNGITPLWAE